MNDITKIRVGTNTIGIIGLKQVFQDVSENAGDMIDDAIKKRLIEALGKRNYIAPPAKERYETAFFREYCKFCNRPYEKEPDNGLVEIKVLGQGCTRCDQLERDIMTIVSEMKVKADIEHVRDIREIANYGVMGSPGLVIDGVVKAVGKVPGKHAIMTWISQAVESRTIND